MQILTRSFRCVSHAKRKRKLTNICNGNEADCFQREVFLEERTPILRNLKYIYAREHNYSHYIKTWVSIKFVYLISKVNLWFCCDLSIICRRYKGCKRLCFNCKCSSQCLLEWASLSVEVHMSGEALSKLKLIQKFHC